MNILLTNGPSSTPGYVVNAPACSESAKYPDEFELTTVEGSRGAAAQRTILTATAAAGALWSALDLSKASIHGALRISNPGGVTVTFEDERGLELLEINANPDSVSGWVVIRPREGFTAADAFGINRLADFGQLWAAATGGPVSVGACVSQAEELTVTFSPWR